MSAKPETNKLPQIVLVVAAADNDVIGAGGKLPWHLRSDLQHFRALTMGKPVVMGRKTYLSIGRPLPGRTNIVVSRDPAFAGPGLLIAPTLETALTAARGDALRRGSDIMVIGGAEIFAQLLSAAARLELTRVHLRPEGDVLSAANRVGRVAGNRPARFPTGTARRCRFHRDELPVALCNNDARHVRLSAQGKAYNPAAEHAAFWRGWMFHALEQSRRRSWGAGPKGPGDRVAIVGSQFS